YLKKRGSLNGSYRLEWVLAQLAAIQAKVGGVKCEPDDFRPHVRGPVEPVGISLEQAMAAWV
ncbi:hypothetical protein JTM67_37530, partial [Pseudomonas aeruginosa]|nr:hypothetical protein [Pseudomonas aeruginosa]